MGTNFAPFIVDLFLFCYESQLMTRINTDFSKQHLVEKFNNIFKYLDDILALNKYDFNNYTSDVHLVELSLNIKKG